MFVYKDEYKLIVLLIVSLVNNFIGKDYANYVWLKFMVAHNVIQVIAVISLLNSFRMYIIPESLQRLRVCAQSKHNTD